MSLRVIDLMAQGVVIARPDHTVDYVRRQMRTLEINAVPVADPDGKPLGILRASDLIQGVAADTPVDKVMTLHVPTIESTLGIREAAQLMVRQRVHHLIVTQAGKISGILSSFDFLELIGSHRFEMIPDEPEFHTGIYQVPDPAP